MATTTTASGGHHRVVFIAATNKLWNKTIFKIYFFTCVSIQHNSLRFWHSKSVHVYLVMLQHQRTVQVTVLVQTVSPTYDPSIHFILCALTVDANSLCAKVCLWVSSIVSSWSAVLCSSLFCFVFCCFWFSGFLVASFVVCVFADCCFLSFVFGF